MAASQELYADFGAPLLFTLPSEQPAEYRTPLSRHSPLRDSGTISSARRSVTPPGSVHTDTTPPRPPPIMRLQDTLMTDAEGGAALSPPGAAAAAAAAQAAEQAAAAAAAAAAGGGNMMRVEGYTQPDDTWITVFGFTPDDLPLVLREFQRCGDILQWGTFGASPQSNFMHIQYQTKYGAQRALQRGGEQLSSSLIIGVKQLEPRHRALVEAWSSGGGADGRSPVRVKAPIGPVRPYKVDSTQAQALPMRSRTWMHKVNEFVFGI